MTNEQLANLDKAAFQLAMSASMLSGCVSAIDLLVKYQAVPSQQFLSQVNELRSKVRSDITKLNEARFPDTNDDS